MEGRSLVKDTKNPMQLRSIKSQMQGMIGLPVNDQYTAISMAEQHRTLNGQKHKLELRLEHEISEPAGYKGANR